MILYQNIKPELTEDILDRIYFVDMKWLLLLDQLWKRDSSKCKLWESLSKEDKSYVLLNYRDEFEFQKYILDGAHIIPRSKNKDTYYDLDNLVLVCRYFHSLLDTLKHPVTKESITSEERLEWLYRARNYRRLN